MRNLTPVLVLLGLLLGSSVSAHEGHQTKVAWEACDRLDLGADCSFEDGHGSLYIGTCRSMSGDMVCVRNKPIQRALTGSTTSTPVEKTPDFDWKTLIPLSVLAGLGTIAALIYIKSANRDSA